MGGLSLDVWVQVAKSSPFVVYVEGTDCRFPVWGRPGMTVDTLEEKVDLTLGRLGVKRGTRRLMLNGEVVERGYPLTWYKLGPGSKLVLLWLDQRSAFEAAPRAARGQPGPHGPAGPRACHHPRSPRVRAAPHPSIFPLSEFPSMMHLQDRTTSPEKRLVTLLLGAPDKLHVHCSRCLGSVVSPQSVNINASLI